MRILSCTKCRPLLAEINKGPLKKALCRCINLAMQKLKKVSRFTYRARNRDIASILRLTGYTSPIHMASFLVKVQVIIRRLRFLHFALVSVLWW
jgi:hypothetical protein